MWLKKLCGLLNQVNSLIVKLCRKFKGFFPGLRLDSRSIVALLDRALNDGIMSSGTRVLSSNPLDTSLSQVEMLLLLLLIRIESQIDFAQSKWPPT